MNRDKEIEILTKSLALIQKKYRPIDGDETLVPSVDYSDPIRFKREYTQVLRREFNLVTLSSKLPKPGHFITADVVGHPVIVVRGDDRQVRAFLNVCRHRGATVVLRPEGHCRRFVCPYHAWTYNTDGSLHRVRHREGFPTLRKEDHGLVELPCSEVAGLIFVCPTPESTPEPLPIALIDELEMMLGPRLTIYASTARTWNANWKLFVEGGIESYHFSIAHKDTIARYFGDTTSTWERIGSHLRLVLPKRSIVDLESLPKEAWHIRDHTHIVYTLHPNAMILLQKSHFDLILIHPLSVDRTHIEILTVGATPETEEFSSKTNTFFEQNHAFSVQTLNEDFKIGEQIQRGVNTMANTHFRFGRFEGALTDWRCWLDAQL